MVKVLQQNTVTWIHDRKFLTSYVQAMAEQNKVNHPANGTWTAVSMSRQRESRAFLRKNLIDPRVPWRHKRQEMMAIARIIQVRMACKFKPISDLGYRLYKRAREQHRRYEICRKRHMSTSTGLSAMEWRSCLPPIWGHLYASWKNTNE